MPAQFSLERAPKGYQQLTVSNTAVGLTVPAGATRAVVYVEAQPIRWRDDAVAPTSSVGVPAIATNAFELPSVQSLNGFKAIRSGSTDATLNIVYYGA
jgi:hypothetical protein